MERLTFEGNFCDIAQCRETPGGSFCEAGTCSQRQVWERLKAYEDTGLEPEEINAAISIKAWDEAVEDGYHEAIMELKEYYDLGDIDHLRALLAAEKDGRLVVLPCKVGDTVYSLDWNYKNEKFQVHNTIVTNVRYDSCDDTVTICDGDYLRILGKSVFLTREEAVAAQGGEKHG